MCFLRGYFGREIFLKSKRLPRNRRHSDCLTPPLLIAKDFCSSSHSGSTVYRLTKDGSRTNLKVPSRNLKVSLEGLKLEDKDAFICKNLKWNHTLGPFAMICCDRDDRKVTDL